MLQLFALALQISMNALLAVIIATKMPPVKTQLVHILARVTMVT